ncbi:class I SAM-dependent methyltransferase [Tetragenococcus solitarius]|uniref:Class I SAM-dependent methyltransferase n=1 Tax=Tetragenococcus solitarius TaxID=71453 RepID=A0ABN3Y3B6_9ENTE|nr:class I SAM-dependent methyltransferase [Tetragenococcus solitarius]
MYEDLNEIKKFWNDFAKEYTAIQRESQLSIQQDVVTYLQRQALLPQESFLDLAGGSGKYISYFIPYVKKYVLVDLSSSMLQIAADNYKYPNLSLVESSQQAFLAQTQNRSFDLVFSAMNPALTTIEQLKEVIRVSKKYVCILRLVQEEDLLFSPIEEKLYGKPEELSWMSTYKKWLKNSFHSKTFHYTVDEKISAAFFRLYFADELSITELNEKMKQLFQGKKEIKNTTHYTFELLCYRVKQ